MSDYLQNQPIPKFNHRNCGLVAGTTNTLTTTLATECSINSRFAVPVAVLTNSATTPTTDANTGVAFVSLVNIAAGGQSCAFVLGQNAAGTVKVVQGPIVATDSLGVTTTPGNQVYAPQFPPLPDDFVPLAYTVARTSPTGTPIIFGTTSWAASGVTFSAFQNVAGFLPPRPAIS